MKITLALLLGLLLGASVVGCANDTLTRVERIFDRAEAAVNKLDSSATRLEDILKRFLP